MNLSAWLNYLETLHPTEIELGLDRVREVATRLPLDLAGKRIVSIAGTNGKGSTAKFLEQLILASGHSVGLYRSPHLLHYNERVCINGAAVEDDGLCEAFQSIEEARQDVSLTYFEFGTLAALLLFVAREVEYLVLEVGLGGRLDAVNLVDPDIAIITNIAMDHMQWLGESREQIGREKAGIMRQRRPVLYGETDMPDSIRARAGALQSPLQQYGREFDAQAVAEGWSWRGQGADGNEAVLFIPALPTSLLTLFPANAALALQAFYLLGLGLDTDIPGPALASTTLQGRFQVIRRKHYTLVLDVAHNPHAMARLVTNLQRCFPAASLHVLIAMLKDKEHAMTIAELLPLQPRWYVAGLEISRGSSAKMLYNALQSSGQTEVNQYADVRQAFSAIEEEIGAGEVLVVTGSFYTVAAVLGLI